MKIEIKGKFDSYENKGKYTIICLKAIGEKGVEYYALKMFNQDKIEQFLSIPLGTDLEVTCYLGTTNNEQYKLYMTGLNLVFWKLLKKAEAEKYEAGKHEVTSDSEEDLPF